MIIQWVLATWKEISLNLIKKSFVSCALIIAVHGSDDDKIHCFKKGQLCKKGSEILCEQLNVINEVENNLFVLDAVDIDDATPMEIVIEGTVAGESDDEDVDIEEM